MNNDTIKKELLDSILPFWNAMEDKEFGGVCNYMSNSGVKNTKADKLVILIARNLWFYSALYEINPTQEIKDIATRYYTNLLEQFVDSDGGLVYTISYDNKKISTVKNVYFQSFGVYALSRYAQSFNDSKALERALELFNFIETNFKDSIGYIEQIPAGENIIADCGVVADKTMNSVLHILEAYTELYIASKNETVKTALTELIKLSIEKIYNPKAERLEVFFDNQYNSLADYHSYGHDIEATWLIDRAAEAVNDSELAKKVYAVTDVICKKIQELAFDGTAIINERVDSEIDTCRIWWVQAEAVVGFYKNYLRSGNNEYKAIAETVLDSIFKYQKNPIGEWYWRVFDNNEPDMSEPLAGSWKCPYHNGRMCIELLQILNNKED